MPAPSPFSLKRSLPLTAALLTAGCGGGEAPCGSGSWQPGALEIHHLSLGQADGTLIVAPSGRSLLVDVGESQPDSSHGARQVGQRVEAVLGCRQVDQVLITHFHLDHVGIFGEGGLWHLVARQGFRVGQLHHRDIEQTGEGGPTLASWRGALGQRPAAFPASVVRAGQALDLGPEVTVRVVAADGVGALLPGPAKEVMPADAPSYPPSENDYSVALHLRYGRLDYFLGGDLSGTYLRSGAVSYHDVETVVARGLPDMDVYRVNHHGSAFSSNPTFLGQIDPLVAIVSAGRGSPHGHPHRATLDRLLATGAVHLTGGASADWPPGVRGGGPEGIVLRSLDGNHYTVDGQRFTADDPRRLDADGDGYFREVDPDDADPSLTPAPSGGCDPVYQRCSALPFDQALVSGAPRD